MSNKTSYIITALLVFLLFNTVLASAQTSTESAQGLRDSVKQKVEEELSQIKKAVSKKAFLGTITAKSEATVTLNNYRNESRQALVTTDSTIKLKNNRDGTLKDLSVGDYILVMGDVDSQNTMTAKRLLVIAPPSADMHKFTFGKITAIGGTITFETPSKETLVAKLSSSTIITRLEAGKAVNAKSADLKTGNTVAVISKPGTTFSVTDIQIVTP